jgi:hypothetical protein
LSLLPEKRGGEPHKECLAGSRLCLKNAFPAEASLSLRHPPDII